MVDEKSIERIEALSDTPQDTLQTIVCITGFMKQIQCNATPSLNIKTAATNVWLYFIRRTMRLGYVDTTTAESSDYFEYP